MFLLDDLFVRPFVSVLEVLHSMAVQELYDVERVRDDMKENRLLYELGERSEEEYRTRKAELEQELNAAEQARENLNGRVEVYR